MRTTLDYGNASVEDMHAGIQQIGNDQEKRRADELLKNHQESRVDEERAEYRMYLMTTLAGADLRYDFSPEGKAERQKIIDDQLNRMFPERIGSAH